MPDDMSPDVALPFTPRELRDALGLFPTGVAVITATTETGERLGATVSSFNSVSLDPPLVLFSLGRNANSIKAWAGCAQFAVNVLGENQSEVSTRFAKAKTDKWDGIDPIKPKVTDAPLLRDALVHFECQMWAQYDGGDHVIFIGRVLHLARSDALQPRPLVFAVGQYRRLDLGAEIETPYNIFQLASWMVTD